jgi:hypothetical protein
MNLLLIAPLYDNKGQVRYFLGCQVDVSSMIEGGRGLESFAELLSKDRTDSRFGSRVDRDPKQCLGDLGELLNENEANSIVNRTRRFSTESRESLSSQRPSQRGRRVLGMDDAKSSRTLWPHPSLGPNGRLPGVYQNVSAPNHLQILNLVDMRSIFSSGPSHH